MPLNADDKAWITKMVENAVDTRVDRLQERVDEINLADRDRTQAATDELDAILSGLDKLASAGASHATVTQLRNSVNRLRDRLAAVNETQPEV